MAATKIKIDKKIKVSKPRFSFSRKRPAFILLMIFSIITLLLLASGTFFVLIPASRISTAVTNITDIMEKLRVDLESKNLSKLDEYVSQVSQELAVINTEVDRYEFLKDMESTRGYYQNLQVMRQISSQAQKLAGDTLPELKVILKSAGYQVAPGEDIDPGEPTEDSENLEGIIRELPRVIKLYEDIEPQINELIATFNKIDPNYIPALGSGSLRSRVMSIQAVTSDFPAVSAELKQTLGILPQLLGAEKPTNYLIVFQNEKEMRASGGLITAYATMSIDKGDISDSIKAVDMWDLEIYVSYTLGVDTGNRNIYGQNALMNARPEIKYYGCGSTYLRAQDSGIYPDLNWTMENFRDYYDVANKYDPKKYPAYDHIIILNTFFASDLVSLVQPINIEGQPEINSENLAKVIFANTSSAGLNPEIRKNFIGEVATAAKDKFNSLSAGDFPRVIQVFLRTIQAKNLAFYSKDKAVQAYFDEMGMGGRIEKNFSGDYFNLSEAQVCSLKSNFYVTNTVKQDIEIKSDGSITKAINIKWTNEKLYDPAEENILSGGPNYNYRAWIRIFTPKDTVFKSTDGYRRSLYFYQPVSYFDKIVQKQTSDNVIWFDQRRLKASDPVRGTELNVGYVLPKGLNYDPNTGYRLLIQKHPGKRAEKYTINIKHNDVATSVEFELTRDKVLTYKDGVITVSDFDTRLDQYYNLMESIKN